MHFRILFSLAATLCLSNGLASSQTFTLDDLRAKRDALTGFSQEFVVTDTSTSQTSAETRSSKTSFAVDISQERFRSVDNSAGGAIVRIFDGKKLIEMEQGGSEYTWIKPSKKDPEPLPGPYRTAGLELPQAVQRSIDPCDLSGLQHKCVTFQIPLNVHLINLGNDARMHVADGACYIVFDTATGLIVAYRLLESIEFYGNLNQYQEVYRLKQVSYNKSFDPSYFALPANATEVKKLPHEDVISRKRELIGKAAPGLTLIDIKGQAIHLSDLKGKTVLLDFWTTWCRRCREDASALDHLQKKYGTTSLVIIGISVDEDRAVVEKLLSEYPRGYPIVLTTENQMPTPYRVSAYPTYVVIDSDGNFAAATSGVQGFFHLRGLFKNVGLETN